MSYSTKNKLLIAVLLLLVLANIATITVFWLGRGKHLVLPPRGQPADYLVMQLGFDARQKADFMELVQQHRAQTKTLRQQVKTAKDNFFKLLQLPSLTDSEKTIAAKNISLITEQLDIMTFDHFKKVRALCNADQQFFFDAVIQDVLRMNGGAPGPGADLRDHGRPEGPPPGEREDSPPPTGDEKPPPPSHY